VVPALERFELVVDDDARRWLGTHPEVSKLFIAFESMLCCLGVRA
jgi:hypothetical protein